MRRKTLLKASSTNQSEQSATNYKEKDEKIKYNHKTKAQTTK